MEEINSLYFNDIEVENEFRTLLSQFFLDDEIFDNEIELIPIDSDMQEAIHFPCVTVEVLQNGSISPDDVQLQAYTNFTIEINVYTNGENKTINNRQLCNGIIGLLQSNGPLTTYYCRGLTLEENTEVGTLLDSACRRTIRMSGLCDNRQKLIYRGE